MKTSNTYNFQMYPLNSFESKFAPFCYFPPIKVLCGQLETWNFLMWDKIKSSRWTSLSRIVFTFHHLLLWCFVSEKADSRCSIWGGGGKIINQGTSNTWDTPIALITDRTHRLQVLIFQIQIQKHLLQKRQTGRSFWFVTFSSPLDPC